MAGCQLEFILSPLIALTVPLLYLQELQSIGACIGWCSLDLVRSVFIRIGQESISTSEHSCCLHMHAFLSAESVTYATNIIFAQAQLRMHQFKSR